MSDARTMRIYDWSQVAALARYAPGRVIAAGTSQEGAIVQAACVYGKQLADRSFLTKEEVAEQVVDFLRELRGSTPNIYDVADFAVCLLGSE